MSSKSNLYLIPTFIAKDTVLEVIPNQVKTAVSALDYFFVEDVRTARRYISSLKLGKKIEDLVFEKLNKNTSPEELEEMFRKPLEEGKSIGIISESGCPGIADPGAKAVEYAHRKKMRVVPLVGPSSLFLALMGSGFNGQSFAFVGYLPIDRKERKEAMQRIEKTSATFNQTQIFIETPYRNDKVLFDLIANLSPNTRLCVAKDVTGEGEIIISKPISEWKKKKIELGKCPSIFLIHA